MDLSIPVLLLLIALMFGVAFIYSNLGLGGGLLFVPIMLSAGVGSSKVVAAISLTLTIMTALSSAINHRKKGFVDFRLGATLVAGTLVGTYIGSTVHLLYLDEGAFRGFFVAILFLFGGMMLRDWIRNVRSVDEDDDAKMTPARLGATTVAMTGSGFLSGSLGVGGGLLNVPLMVYALGRKTRKAIGTSSLIIMPTAAFGFFVYLYNLSTQTDGFVVPPEFVLIPILMPFVFVGAFLGSRWGLAKLKTREVALIFILVLFVAAANLVLGILGIL